jgi:MFS transporter, DHA1 family, multidrug resistance protein
MNHLLKKESGTPEPHKAMASGGGHGMMAHDDPKNPQNWPLFKKVYVSSVAWSYTFVLLFGLTSYAGGIPLVMKEFDVTMVKAILPFSLFLFGVFFAPIITPHLSEKFGRMPVYLVSLPLMELFIVGASQSKSYPALAVTRFFAGFFGGPSVVLIEGTFADVWSAQFTSTYVSRFIHPRDRDPRSP